MDYLVLPCGESVPVLGQGCWHLGDNPDNRKNEMAALRAGLDHGLSLIDTAEMYGDGRSEDLVGEAISGRRDEAFLVSKVLPSNAGSDAMVAACEASLNRLRTDHLDLYLLHWQGSVPFDETIRGFERLQGQGKIRHYGISNLDLGQTRAFTQAGGRGVQVNQLLYNLDQRGVEWELLPWLRAQGLATMAYSPFDEGRLATNETLHAFAQSRGMTTGQAALAWLLHQKGVLAIPKSAHAERVAENAAAAEITFSTEDLAELDRAFPPPSSPASLAIY